MERLELEEYEKTEADHTAYWNGWSTSAFIGCDETGEPKYARRKYYRCSRCRYGTVVRYNYCPKCGAKMMEEAERAKGGVE